MLYFFYVMGIYFLVMLLKFFFLCNAHFFLSKVVSNNFFLSNVIEVVLHCMEKNLQLSYKMYERKKISTYLI